MRYAMKFGLWRPLLLLLGARRANSYLEVEPTSLTLRFGWFRITLPRARLQEARRARWPLWGGIGWRIGYARLGLISSRKGVVELRFSEAQRARLLLLPVKFRSVFISLEEPDALLAELGAQRAPAAKLLH